MTFLYDQITATKNIFKEMRKKQCNQILLIKYIALKKGTALTCGDDQEPKRVTGQLLNYLISHSTSRVMKCDQFQNILRFPQLVSNEK
jgi:hypothetical protein